jgi:Dolichyl-phosphate-mannose-protein mannosyltransferase
VAVDVARPESSTAAAELPLARLAALPARWVLSALVGFGFAIRTLLALAHATPIYLPDEYIYSTLARSLAESGRPLIRGETVTFPALLEPILAAPFWLVGDVTLAYRLTQGMHALAMALAAVPAYLLVRRLGGGKWLGIGAAALAVAGPSLVYTSYVTADAVAYPLVLAAVYAGVGALARPTARGQLAFLAFAGLASFARVQYVVLPLAYLGAALLVERGRIRRHAVVLVALVLPLVGALALGPRRVLGYYAAILDLEPTVGNVAHSLSTQLLGLAYSSGWALLPAALVAVALGLWRPARREEAAFAGLVTVLGACLLGEAALYALDDPQRFKERYLIALPPLVAPAFVLWLRRGAPARLAVVLGSLGLLVVAVLVPMAPYAVGENRQDSPFLDAVFWLSRTLGQTDASFAVMNAALVLCLLAVGVALRPGRTTAALAIAATLAVGLAGSAGVHAEDQRAARKTLRTFLPSDPQWIDHGPLDDVALVLTPGSPRGLGFEQLFWNRSIEDVLRHPGAEPIDAFGQSTLTIARDGRLLADGKVVRQPLLVSQYGSTAVLAGAVRVRQELTVDLWRPLGTPRMAMLVEGRYFDGWLGARGRVTVWPDRSGRVEGTLKLGLTLPGVRDAVTLELRAPGFRRDVRVEPGTAEVVRVPLSAAGPWTLTYRAKRPLFLHGRLVSVRAPVPLLERTTATASDA